MSHQPERKEKNCLNCGVDLIGRYCHRCGQENIVTHQSFWALTRHFIYDVFHFDGSFFNTVYYLFARPGFVAKEYINGKRKSYLDPIRMYLFTSALFFLVFFSVKEYKVGPGDVMTYDNKDRIELADVLESRKTGGEPDSALVRRIQLLRDTNSPLANDSIFKFSENQLINFTNKRYQSVAAYDSIQKLLPAEKRDGWLTRLLVRQSIEKEQKYTDRTQLTNSFINTFLHQLPFMLFISLPFFGLILKLLYIRRKEFYYSDHAVFTLYHYIFSFILLLLIFAASAMNEYTGWSIFRWIMVLLFVSWPVYLFLQMKNFYGQSKKKTFGKFFLLNMIGSILLLLLFLGILLFSFYKV